MNAMQWLAIAAVVVQGVFALALLLFWRNLGAWTEETRRERISADLLRRSNQNVVDFLARATHTTTEQLKPLDAAEFHPFHDKVKESA